MNFIYAFDLDEFLPSHNFSVDGKLLSPNAVAYVDAAIREKHRRVEDLSMDELARGLAAGVVTPRFARFIRLAALLRSGQELVNGYGNRLGFSEAFRTETLKLNETELAFEQRRREIAPTKVSRLSCLYLAERSDAGRVHVRTMLGDVFILDVRIALKLNLTRADTAWFDNYCNAPTVEYVTAYWSGLPSANPRWEYLLDGVIAIEDFTQLAYVRQYGNNHP